jgi:penicillin V acylase-like amidase (Ntn superfamily)
MKTLQNFLLIILVMLQNVSFAYTTFFLKKNGQMVFGRNYDWVTAIGMINTNLRGVIKHSLDLEHRNVLQWQSKYGSVTFNQYGREFANGGMNEKGLVVELMWLNESKYPAPDNRPGLSVLQWIQYQLDNCSSVDEVIATDKKVRIVSTGTPQHYLVADSKGNVATIEFLSGKMVVHRGSNLPYPVLANDTYNASLQNASASSNKGFQANSGDRFARACALVQQYKKADTKKPIVDYSFDLLNNVAQGNFTKWSIVYDITNRRIFFKTSVNPDIKSFDVNAFDYSCSSNALAFNMNQKASGNINKLFTAYSNNVNYKMLKEAFTESKNEVAINETLQQGVAQTAESVVKCK